MDESKLALPEPPYDWAFVLEMVEKRLGMWVGRDTYERAVALVTGFDMSQPMSVHGPMQARLQERMNAGPIFWTRALLAEALGRDLNDLRDLGPLSVEDDKRAINLLVSELRVVVAEMSEASEPVPLVGADLRMSGGEDIDLPLPDRDTDSMRGIDL